MDKKNKKLVWLVIILVILGILFIVLRLANRAPVSPPVDNTNEVLEIETKSVDLEFDSTIEPKETNTEFTAINLAKSYVARFGSWSTDNQGHNLEELMPLSSTRMRTYLRNIEINNQAEDFRGVTTKSLSADIIYLNDDDAKLVVGTQKIETDANLTEDIYYQDVEVFLIKSGNEWLVDEVDWQ